MPAADCRHFYRYLQLVYFRPCLPSFGLVACAEDADASVWQVTAVAGLGATAVCALSASTSEGDAHVGQAPSHLAIVPHPIGVLGGSLHQLHGLCVVCIPISMHC